MNDLMELRHDLEAEEQALWQERQRAVAYSDECYLAWQAARKRADALGKAWYAAFCRREGV